MYLFNGPFLTSEEGVALFCHILGPSTTGGFKDELNLRLLYVAQRLQSDRTHVLTEISTSLNFFANRRAPSSDSTCIDYSAVGSGLCVD